MIPHPGQYEGGDLPGAVRGEQLVASLLCRLPRDERNVAQPTREGFELIDVHPEDEGGFVTMPPQDRAHLADLGGVLRRDAPTLAVGRGVVHTLHIRR